MLSNNNTVRVVLPDWIWEQSKNETEIKKHILQYMQRYPDYTIKKVKGRHAICEINRLGGVR